MSKTKTAYKELMRFNWSSATVSFYTVDRIPPNRNGLYYLKSVNIDKKLQKKLRAIAESNLQKYTGAREYDFETSDSDEELLCIESKETEFSLIEEKLENSSAIKQAVKMIELIGSWMYVVELADKDGGEPVYAARRLSDSWGAKKVFSPTNMIFQDEMLVDIDEKQIFRVDHLIDFLVFKETIFVLNKKNFELLLNFRETMITSRDQCVDALEKRGLIKNADILRGLVGDNTRRLRKLAKVYKSGFFNEKGFVANLIRVSKQEGWGIKFNSKNEIDVTEDTIDLILTVLNNDRLRSPINKKTYDVDVKNVVSK